MVGESTGFASPIEIKGSGIALEIVLGSVIGAVILVIIVAVVLFLLWKKRNPPYTQVVRLENGQGKLHSIFYHLPYFILLETNILQIQCLPFFKCFL